MLEIGNEHENDAVGVDMLEIQRLHVPLVPVLEVESQPVEAAVQLAIGLQEHGVVGIKNFVELKIHFQVGVVFGLEFQKVPEGGLLDNDVLKSLMSLEPLLELINQKPFFLLAREQIFFIKRRGDDGRVQVIRVP